MTYTLNVKGPDGDGSRMRFNLDALVSLASHVSYNHLTGRIAFVRFPVPYADVTLTDGEVLTPAKYQRVLAASRVFGQIGR